MTDLEVDPSDTFDFDLHRKTAEEEYSRRRQEYVEFADLVAGLLTGALRADGLAVHRVEQRAKSIESFGSKAARLAEDKLDAPKYPTPMSDVTDIAACRVITFFVQDISRVRSIVEREFDVLEGVDRSSFKRPGGRLGYESFHFVVKLNRARRSLAEYKPYASLVIEIQVRTILQHAWAEVEHDIRYKRLEDLPEEVSRRFMALAGMIEVADREFQAIADYNEQLEAAAAISIDTGKYAEAELTTNALKRYLDRQYAPDGRMRNFGYSWMTQLLRNLGVRDIEQLNSLISPYSDDAVSRAVWGSRQGQLSRLEDVLLAAVGPDRYIAAYPSKEPSGEPHPWVISSARRRALQMTEAGIAVNQGADGKGPP